jgi:hypothetical protein
MDLYENNVHPFVIKIWLEEISHETGEAMWRGHITHVPSGERRYIQRLEEIALVIAPYLERMGVRLGWCWQVKSGWIRCKHSLLRRWRRGSR